MIVHTNWNLDLKDILKLQKEVKILTKRFNNNCFDWRIFSHPTSNFSLKKVLNNKGFTKFLDTTKLNDTDRILIKFFKTQKKILKFSELNVSSPANFMYVKSHGYVDRVNRYEHKLNQEGIDYLIAKIYIRWCRYKKERLEPLQRIVVYRLTSHDKKLSTIKNFSLKMGYCHLWVSNYERGRSTLRPILIKRLMKNIESKFKKQIQRSIMSKINIEEAYNTIGKKRYNQLCYAAKTIHPTLQKRLTKEEYRIYQTSRIRNCKASPFEQKIINKLIKTSQKFEIHPSIENYHFDLALPSSNKPKLIIEAIPDWYLTDKIALIKKKLPNLTFVAIVADTMRDGQILLLKKHFDLVYRFSQMDRLINKIQDEKNFKNFKFVDTLPKVSIEVGNKSSKLWQGYAEKHLKEILIKNKLIYNKDFYHELPIALNWQYGKDVFLPDFIFLPSKKVKGIIIETTSIDSDNRQCLRRRIGKIISKFEIYRTIARLNYYFIAALYIKNNKLTKSFEVEKLKKSNYCDLTLINEDINNLPSIIKELRDGG